MALNAHRSTLALLEAIFLDGLYSSVLQKAQTFPKNKIILLFRTSQSGMILHMLLEGDTVC